MHAASTPTGLARSPTSVQGHAAPGQPRTLALARSPPHARTRGALHARLRVTPRPRRAASHAQPARLARSPPPRVQAPEPRALGARSLHAHLSSCRHAPCMMALHAQPRACKLTLRPASFARAALELCTLTCWRTPSPTALHAHLRWCKSAPRTQALELCTLTASCASAC